MELDSRDVWVDGPSPPVPIREGSLVRLPKAPESTRGLTSTRCELFAESGGGGGLGLGRRKVNRRPHPARQRAPALPPFQLTRLPAGLTSGGEAAGAEASDGALSMDDDPWLTNCSLPPVRLRGRASQLRNRGGLGSTTQRRGPRGVAKASDLHALA
eukprot:TRINITY_DN21197_c0_g1_i1.p2 TRINITY_DN21197_c0_g1~~TRINITY_DN21197_c0_g1_i1.p2  ORF type:complete len:157 (-),score=27.37 TRINITY_DN21197_c0_g1_i1:98-568(-)